MNVVLFGAPGSGKGTQADKISEFLSVKKISLGDLLRKEVKAETLLGKEVKNYMDKGALAPDELVARIIEQNLNSSGFLLDGYPRNLQQAEKLDDILKKQQKELDMCIHFVVGSQMVIDRLSQRRVCSDCGVNYHLTNMPSKKEGLCDSCGGQLTQRKDDHTEVIKKRWDVFSAESKQVLDFYRGKNNLVEVNAEGDASEVLAIVKEKICLQNR